MKQSLLISGCTNLVNILLCTNVTTTQLNEQKTCKLFRVIVFWGIQKKPIIDWTIDGTSTWNVKLVFFSLFQMKYFIDFETTYQWLCEMTKPEIFFYEHGLICCSC